MNQEIEKYLDNLEKQKKELSTLREINSQLWIDRRF